MTHKSYMIDVTSTINGAYAYIDVILPKVDNGEYEYQLLAGEQILSSGLCQIGDIQHTATEYNNEVKYTQYNG